MAPAPHEPLRPFEPGALRALDALGIAVTVFDRSGRLVHVNAPAERWLGAPAADLVGRPYLESPAAQRGDAFDLAFRAVAEGEPAREVESPTERAGVRRVSRLAACDAWVVVITEERAPGRASPGSRTSSTRTSSA